MTTDMQILVSIIIPVFNVEKYLDACIDSVLNQSYSAIEVILVNDGSTDKSGNICDEWAKKDSRIIVIHKKNEGLNYARRDGFKKSSGKYVTFLDSDDLIHKENIALSLNVLLKNSADALVYASKEFSDKTKEVDDLLVSTEGSKDLRILDSKEKILRYAILGEPLFPDSNYMTAWGKLYSRHLIKNIKWQESNFRSYEDNFWTPLVLSKSGKVVLLSSQLHFYRRNAAYGSHGVTLGNRLTGNSFNGKSVGFIEYLDLLHKFYNKLEEEYKLGIKTELQDLYYKQSWSRLSVLIEVELLHEENNLQYLKSIWSAHQQMDWDLLRQNASQSERLLEYSVEIDYLRNELDNLYSIKRAARRLAGNIKRKFFKS